MTVRRLLVAGATGFVGRPLVERLVAEGHAVRAMTRQPNRYDGPGDPVAGDVADAASLAQAVDGIEVAYYLVHSLGSDDFEQHDARAAEAFGRAATT